MIFICLHIMPIKARSDEHEFFAKNLLAIVSVFFFK